MREKPKRTKGLIHPLTNRRKSPSNPEKFQHDVSQIASANLMVDREAIKEDLFAPSNRPEKHVTYALPQTQPEIDYMEESWPVESRKSFDDSFMDLPPLPAYRAPPPRPPRKPPVEPIQSEPEPMEEYYDPHLSYSESSYFHTEAEPLIRSQQSSSPPISPPPRTLTATKSRSELIRSLHPTTPLPPVETRSRQRSHTAPDTLIPLDRDTIEVDWIVVHKKDEMEEMKKMASSHKKETAFYRESQVFGVPLQDLLDRDGVRIPHIVVQCINYLRQHGLETEGLFRISPNQEELLEITEKFNDGQRVDFLNPRSDPHLVAGVLKKYLRDMPPILTFENYSCFIAVHGMLERVGRIKSAHYDEFAHVTKLVSVFQMLPLLNRDLFHFILVFLADVISKEEHNKMGLSNLSMVFAPLLLRSGEVISDPSSMLSESAALVQLVETMIVHRAKFSS
eukprot:TRINITY_DN4425_c0_g1_i1.p1 TRINITY_DN4425_c0_g1~~TRINITY_DN4425_c0_g1_i1.p1  ORF type:complete len:511 (-),score=117.45 TRINITY_DN4425_c0_g1_i1:120-1472(-)